MSAATLGRRPELLALLSAVFFGASIPLSKILLGQTHALALSGLLYMGSGMALSGLLLTGRFMGRGMTEAPLSRDDAPWLAGAILCGGVLAPLCFLTGLDRTPGSTASLMLNLETPFTVLLAALLFHEAIGGFAWGALACALAGSLLLSYDAGPSGGGLRGPVLLAASCGLWAMDNNLTRNISHKDPVSASAIKGLAAGTALLGLTAAFGVPLPDARRILAALAVGAVCYGASLVLFVRSLRALGTGRTGIIFATGPFIGSLVSIVVLGEPVKASLLAGGVLMAAGTWLLLREDHGHDHRHERHEHDHGHTHDDHHGHEHAEDGVEGEHSHPHLHPELEHSHPHRPDIHHRHPH
ncbi:MAG: DMT family transporter [Elusimicrobia bacterium]|nr:DMT family transporter [Elusimicrobiota bacterium]